MCAFTHQDGRHCGDGKLAIVERVLLQFGLTELNSDGGGETNSISDSSMMIEGLQSTLTFSQHEQEFCYNGLMDCLYIDI